MDKLLFWLDLETTGLVDTIDYVLEIGIGVSDLQGNVVDSRDWIVPVATRAKAAAVDRAKRDSVVGPMYMKSGLWDDLDSAEVRLESEIEDDIIDWVSTFGVDYDVPMAGSSVHFDRKFIFKYFPIFHEFFHYRNIDVSTLKGLCQLHAPDTYLQLSLETCPRKLHRVAPDILDTVEEYRFYLNNFLKVTT